jgi:hypothetical protein
LLGGLFLDGQVSVTILLPLLFKLKTLPPSNPLQPLKSPVYLPASISYRDWPVFAEKLYDMACPLFEVPYKKMDTTPWVLLTTMNSIITIFVLASGAGLILASVYAGAGAKDMQKTPRAIMNEIIFREMDICTPF